ncbi:hypothetical protein D3Z47_02150 [Lachnospiraceae bacterium]|nr:hypothetical protein [Lachnospiraceae bacterium]
MKYCPYCGAGLPDGVLSFCPECGNVLPGSKKDDKQPDTGKQKTVMKKAASKKSRLKASKIARKASANEGQAADDDYDGYYNDILPMDEGRQWEGIDRSIIKKIALLIACLVVVIEMCIALMYLL